MGKINTILGYETFTSWENPNYSRTYGYNLSQAFTTTGIRLTYQFNPIVNLMVAVNNGWDNVEDNNKGKMIEGGLTLTPHKRFSAYFYGSWAAEQSNCQGQGVGAIPPATGTTVPCVSGAPGTNPSAHRNVLDGIFTYKPTDMDTIILETYYVNEEHAALVPSKTTAGGGSGNARWNSAYLYLIHDFNDQTQPNAFSYRVRGGMFEDAGGARTCTGAVNSVGGNNTCANSPGSANNSGFQGGAGPFNQAGTGSGPGGVAQALTVWEVTNTLQYALFPSLITRTEFRFDHANKNVFLVGNRAANHQETMTFNVVYLF
jgi:hypothetical protein